MATRQFWTLNKLIVFIMIGAFAMLLTEIRFDHSDVLAETWKGWIPVVYSAAMIIAGILGIALWDRGGRRVLLAGFMIAIIVGVLGFYFHNQRQPVARVAAMVGTLFQPIKKPEEGGEAAPAAKAGGPEAGRKGSGQVLPAGGPIDSAKLRQGRRKRPIISRQGPPVFAPLAFCGLGLLGALACAARFQPGTARD
jgi:hypothetical protein